MGARFYPMFKSDFDGPISNLKELETMCTCVVSFIGYICKKKKIDVCKCKVI
jgi:hypothetical protein